MGYRLGVALSGGGARGIAHIGLLTALAESGIEVDCLAGTSSGAIVAAFHAAGHSPATTREFFRTRSPFRLANLALTKPGLIDTAKVTENLLEFFPGNRIEALGKRLYITATDIVNARPVIFHEGPLVPAILASCSYPPVFTPTEIGERWYADGGIVDNFPVEPLKGLCDILIGSYASPLPTVRRADLGSALAIAERALEISTYFASKARFHHCDVVISPPELARFGTFDTRHQDEIYQIGYQAARRRMADIEAAIDRWRAAAEADD